MELVDTPPPASMDAPPDAPAPLPLRAVPWRWSDVLVGLVPLALTRVLPEVIDPASLRGAPSWLWFPMTLLGMIWMLAYPLAVARRRHARLPPLPRPRSVLVEGLFALLAVVVVLVALSVGMTVLVYVYGAPLIPPNPLESIVRSPNRFEFPALIVMAVLVAPVAEELFFRGMLYNTLRQRLHPVVAAPIQAILFALMHPFGLVGSAVIAFLGLALAMVYDRRRTLLASILLHSFWNAMSMAVVAWGIAASANAPVLGVRGDRHDGGIVLTEVLPESAADTAGLRIGDVVTAVDGQPMPDIAWLAQLIRGKKVGDTVEVAFTRNGTAHEVDVVLTRRRE